MTDPKTPKEKILIIEKEIKEINARLEKLEDLHGGMGNPDSKLLP